MKRLICIIVLLYHSCVSYSATLNRIITLGSALTETVDALGYGKNIVAVDVTSIYPGYVNKLPKVSNNRSVSAEALIAFAPDLVLAPERSVSREVQYQLKAAGIRFVGIQQEYSVKGATNFIKAVASVLQVPRKGEKLALETTIKINQARIQVKASTKAPKVIFIYARGAGTMMVAGRKTNVDAIITLAGGKNAVSDFDNFKPYTTEALVKANPDYILMFDFGFNSLGGSEAILKMPGVGQTTAGMRRQLITMDASLLVNFSVRLDQAIIALTRKLQVKG